MAAEWITDGWLLAAVLASCELALRDRTCMGRWATVPAHTRPSPPEWTLCVSHPRNPTTSAPVGSARVEAVRGASLHGRAAVFAASTRASTAAGDEVMRQLLAVPAADAAYGVAILTSRGRLGIDNGSRI